MLSAICFNLDQFRILSSGKGLKDLPYLIFFRGTVTGKRPHDPVSERTAD